MEEKKNEQILQSEAEPTVGGQSKKRSKTRRFLRWALLLLFSPVLLFLVLTILLYIPFIQDWAVGLIAGKLSEETGMKVTVEKLRVSFPLDVEVDKLLILKPEKLTDADLNLSFHDRANSLQSDTVLYVEHALLDLDLSGIFQLRAGVDAFDLQRTEVHTRDMIGSMVLNGKMKHLRMDIHDADFDRNKLNLTHALLDGCDIDIALRDTIIPEDTTTTRIPWCIDFADVSLMNSRVAFHTARDTMSAFVSLDTMKVQKGCFDLAEMVVGLEELSVKAKKIKYDQNYEPYVKGFDVNHIELSDFDMDFSSLSYDLNTGKLSKTRLANLSAQEKCGVQIRHLAADIELDTTRVALHDVVLQTPGSNLRAQVDMDWSALTPRRRGRMDARLEADFSKQDVMLFAGETLSPELLANFPDVLLTAGAEITGNVDAVSVKSVSLHMPDMLDVKLSGTAENLFVDSIRSADILCEAQTGDLSLIQKAFGIRDFRIPALALVADAHIDGDRYSGNIDLQQGRGKLWIDGAYDVGSEAYEASLSADRFTLSNFLPMDSVLCLSATADVKGHGTDFLSPRSLLRALLEVDAMNYGSRDLSDIRLDVLMQKGSSVVNFYSQNEVLNADGCVEMQVQNRKVNDASFNIDMRGIDLYTLGITEKPLNVSMALHMNGHTDLKESHYVKGGVNAIILQTADTVYYPKDIDAEVLMDVDTLFASISAGDLILKANSRQGLQQVIAAGQDYLAELTGQIERKEFDKDALKACLPDVDLCIESGRQNPLANIAYMYGYSYRAFDIDIHTDPLEGIKGEGWIHTVNTGTIVLDTIQFNLKQDVEGMAVAARVCNGRRNPDVTFDARLRATLSPHSASFALVYLDERGRKGVDLGAEAVFHDGTQRIHITPLRPILAYRNFSVNDSNFIAFDPNGRIEADLDLLADDGTGLKLYSTPNEEAEQDLTVSLNRFNLGELCSVIPYMPLVSGFLQGDVHLLQREEVLSVGADLTIKDMRYEGYPMGDVGLNLAYMPMEDGMHYVDGVMSQDKQDILSFSGLYQDLGETDNLDAELQLLRFPMTIANGFLDEMIQLEGFLNGGLTVQGPTSKPLVEGEVRSESVHLLSPNYSVNLRVPDEKMEVRNNRIDLSLLKMYSKGNNPLQLSGFIDFADLDNIQLQVGVNASNFELINAPRNRKAEAYGKVFVNLSMMVRGVLSDLNVTGKLDVLGNSDLTYVLKDSPLTVEDEMADLVTFVDFGDTIRVTEPEVVPPSNLTMRLDINIDQAVQLHCLLSEDGVNYANLEGGGNLMLSYDERRGMELNGRYTILNGRMNYTLMVMTLKNCDIASGSYLEFTGDILNPRLSIAASERLNTTITENQTPRNVAFNVGLNISKTLNDMGLEFTLEAPEDMNIQNELAQMTPEQRGRVAVTMMATGMYVVEGKSSGGYNTTNALNSFLNSQISQITGKALSTIDLSLGVQNTNTASGNITTDYSFRFAKRFWGNRISLIIGGKVSSGAEAENTGQSIIDNVSIEYRLDKSATRYVNVYYDKNYESMLEGEVAEMGAGLVLRRKTTRLGELFLFRNREERKEGKKK